MTGAASASPALLLVAHGSRDARFATSLAALAAAVREARPRLRVGLAFLELTDPTLEQALEAASGAVVVVPALLGAAFHARVDLPSRLAAVQARRPQLSVAVAGVLGPDGRLAAALVERAAGLPGCDGFVLLATGSRRAEATEAAHLVAAEVERGVGRPVRAGFVTGEPAVERAVEAAAAAGASHVGVLAWFLAPGELLDQGVARAGVGAARVGEPLATHPATAAVVLDRYDAAAATLAPAAGQVSQVRAGA